LLYGLSANLVRRASMNSAEIIKFHAGLHYSYGMMASRRSRDVLINFPYCEHLGSRANWGVQLFEWKFIWKNFIKWITENSCSRRQGNESRL
jgi:hypothetical protein